MLEFDLYWSFRSPYCYLLGTRLPEFLSAHDVRCRVRPVYPAAVRNPAFFETVNPLWFKYFNLDVQRCADYLGVPIRWPRPDPVAMDPATRKPAADQARIRRLTRLGVAAEEAGRGVEFICRVGDLLWRGDVEVWDQGDRLRGAVESACLDLADLEARVSADIERFDAAIAANEKAQADAGHWGVPLMVFNGEPFFGQDRFDMLVWRLKQHGLSTQRAETAGE